MLNSLASYLLGYPGSAASSPAEDAGAAKPTASSEPSITAHVPSVDVRLSAVEADDDWLLVDKTEEEAEEDSRSSSPAVNVPSQRLTLAVSTTSYHWPDSEEASGLAGPAVLEESWFVTPPPCFTSGSVPLETSPLENLLIEHPSMSVYHRSAGPQASAAPLSSSVGATPPPRSPQRTNLRKLNRNGGRGARPVAVETSAPPRTPSASVERASSPTRSNSPSPSQTTAVQASPRRPGAFSPYHQQQQQSLQYRTAQKLVQRAACQQLKRDSLERSNKAREIRSSRNKRQRRSDHMQRHSGVNNNRKC